MKTGTAKSFSVAALDKMGERVGLGVGGVEEIPEGPALTKRGLMGRGAPEDAPKEANALCGLFAAEEEEGARLRGSGDGLVSLRGVIDVFVGIDVDYFVFWDWVRWLWSGFRLGVTFGRGLSLRRIDRLHET